ncbi:hypothetical protein JHK86_047730 [Glycine max]|nr:hypothetical protein JHK86_047730 [Glycine max]
MALHSMCSISHVLHFAETFPSLHNAHVLLDLMPLRRKPKRRTRRLMVSTSCSLGGFKFLENAKDLPTISKHRAKHGIGNMRKKGYFKGVLLCYKFSNQ